MVRRKTLSGTQFFIPTTSRKEALKEVRSRISISNKENPRSKHIELKGLRKQKSTVGGNSFFLGFVRKEKKILNL